MADIGVFIESGALPTNVNPSQDGAKILLRGKGSDIINCTPQDVVTREFNGWTSNHVASNGTVECVVGWVNYNGRFKPAIKICQKSGSDYVDLATMSYSAFQTQYDDTSSNHYRCMNAHWDDVNSKFVVLLSGGSSLLRAWVATIDVTDPQNPTVDSFNEIVRPTGVVAQRSYGFYSGLALVGGVAHLVIFFRGNAPGTTSGNIALVVNPATGALIHTSAIDITGQFPISGNLQPREANGYLLINRRGSNNEVQVGFLDPVAGEFFTTEVDMAPVIADPSGSRRYTAAAHFYWDAAESKYVGAMADDRDPAHAYMFAFPAPAATTNGSRQLVTASSALDLGEINQSNSFFSNWLVEVISLGNGSYTVMGFHQPHQKTYEVFKATISGGSWTKDSGSRITYTSPGEDFFSPSLTKSGNFIILAKLYGANLNSSVVVYNLDGTILFRETDLDSLRAVNDTLIDDLSQYKLTKAFSALWIPPEASSLSVTPISVLTTEWSDLAQAPQANTMLNIGRGVSGNPGREKGQVLFVSEQSVTRMADGCVLGTELGGSIYNFERE